MQDQLQLHATPRSASARRPPPRRAKGRRVQLTRAFRAQRASRTSRIATVRALTFADRSVSPEVDQGSSRRTTAIILDAMELGRPTPERLSIASRVIEHTRALGPRSPALGPARNRQKTIEMVCCSDLTPHSSPNRQRELSGDRGGLVELPRACAPRSVCWLISGGRRLPPIGRQRQRDARRDTLCCCENFQPAPDRPLCLVGTAAESRRNVLRVFTRIIFDLMCISLRSTSRATVPMLSLPTGWQVDYLVLQVRAELPARTPATPLPLAAEGG